MRFARSTVTVCKGRVSSARRMKNGDTVFVADESGVLVKKVIPASSRQPIYGVNAAISYGDDCFVLDKGLLERRGEWRYVRE